MMAETMKNATRIGSLMGTWTTWADLKASIGNYQVLAYFVVHFMPDPMAGYGCELGGCRESSNQICQANQANYNAHECKDMAEIQSDWSDVAAFYSIGFHVHAGIPFRVDKVMDTGGWIGPFNLVLAKDIGEETQTQKAGGRKNRTLVDRYRVRYVETASTRFLSRRHENDTLFRGLDFNSVMGSKAVESTRRIQSSLNHGDKPYEKYKATCDNGNLQPILPLYGFEFYELEGQDNNSSNEQIEFEVDYQLLMAPKIHNAAYKLMPWIQKHINRNSAGFGFSFDGPYCYGDDPKRAWTISVSMNSTSRSAVKVQRACVDGFPCLPPAARQGGGTYGSTPAPACPTVLDVWKLLWQVAFGFMLVLWLVTLFVLWRKRNRGVVEADARQEQPREVEGGPEQSHVETECLLPEPQAEAVETNGSYAPENVDAATDQDVVEENAV